MNENENFCKAIEQAVVLPCAKEMQRYLMKNVIFHQHTEEGSAD